MATITLTRAEHGKSVEAQVGDRIIVSLDENPTTGFRWAIDKSDDEWWRLKVPSTLCRRVREWAEVANGL